MQVSRTFFNTLHCKYNIAQAYVLAVLVGVREGGSSKAFGTRVLWTTFWNFTQRQTNICKIVFPIVLWLQILQQNPNVSDYMFHPNSIPMFRTKRLTLPPSPLPFSETFSVLGLFYVYRIKVGGLSSTNSKLGFPFQHWSLTYFVTEVSTFAWSNWLNWLTRFTLGNGAGLKGKLIRQ